MLKMLETIKILRFSIRINGKVTSVSLRKNIISLWMLQVNGKRRFKKEFIYSKIYEFINKSLDEWKYDNGKGFSDFISEKMIQEILEEKDFLEYTKFLKIL